MPARSKYFFAKSSTLLPVIRIFLLLINSASLSFTESPSLGRSSRYFLIASIHKSLIKTIRSLFPLPITFKVFFLKSISLMLMPTSSESLSPQVKKSANIAKSRCLYLPSITFNKSMLCSNDKYFGKRAFNFGVSRFCAGFSEIDFSFI